MTPLSLKVINNLPGYPSTSLSAISLSHRYALLELFRNQKNLSFSELESFYQTSIGVLFAKLFNLTTVSDPRKSSKLVTQSKNLNNSNEPIKVVSCCELICALANLRKIQKFASIHFITIQVTYFL